MGHAADDMGAFDPRQMDAPLGQVRRVLTLIHDKAPSDEVAPEVALFEQMRADVVLRMEKGSLAALVTVSASVQAGFPVAKEKLLRVVPAIEKRRSEFQTMLDMVRELKKVARQQKHNVAIHRMEACLREFLKDLSRIGTRYKTEIERLSTIDSSQSLGAQAQTLYVAALIRRGLQPRPDPPLIDEGEVVPAIAVAAPPDLADDPQGLLAFEDGIHDEVEAAAPHLMGEVVLQWAHDGPA